MPMGKTYIDAYAGIWNVNVGYGREEIVEAVRAQMEVLAFYPVTQINVPAAKLAGRLAEILPGDLNHLFFVNSGSEANETAFKVARQYGRATRPGRKPLQDHQPAPGLSRIYHGGDVCHRTSAPAISIRASGAWLHSCGAPEGRGCTEPDEIARMSSNAKGPDTVAAVIAEPVIGGGGVHVPPGDYFPGLREVCDRFGCLLIMDEVITGFGRTGKLFAAEHWGIVPDVMTIAKGVSSGYLPLAACAVTEKVWAGFLGEPDEGKEFSQVSTYGGHTSLLRGSSGQYRDPDA